MRTGEGGSGLDGGSCQFKCLVEISSICILRSFPSIALRIPTAHNFTHD